MLLCYGRFLLCLFAPKRSTHALRSQLLLNSFHNHVALSDFLFIEAIARMRRRSSSLRSSGRRVPSRTGSTKSQRRMERSQSARSARRPGTAPSDRSEQIHAIPIQNDDHVTDLSPFKAPEVHDVPVREMDDGRTYLYICRFSRLWRFLPSVCLFVLFSFGFYFCVFVWLIIFCLSIFTNLTSNCLH